MAIVEYETLPENVVLAPSGWAKVGNSWQTVEPLRDRVTGLYARTRYATGQAALARLGLRLPTRAEIDARRLETARQNGIVLPVFNLPDNAIMAANGVYQARYADLASFKAAVQRLLDLYMRTPEWAAYHDDLVKAALRDRFWDGRSLVTNIGKLWIGVGPGDVPVARGRSRLMGWWNTPQNKWIQSGYGDPHDDQHLDYGTLLYGVSDADPTLRTDTGNPLFAVLGHALSGAAAAATILKPKPSAPANDAGDAVELQQSAGGTVRTVRGGWVVVPAPGADSGSVVVAPPAYKPAKNITQPMLDWINAILRDTASYPLGAKLDKTFGTRVMQARVETHPANAKIPRPHRGIGLWEATGAAPAPAPAREAPLGDAPALSALTRQIDALSPKRDRRYDGVQASPQHRAKSPHSEHNEGNALDLTADRSRGPNLDQLAEVLLRDPRTHYVIWRGRIANTQTGQSWTPGAWRPYARQAGGEDPHVSHLHLSLKPGLRGDARPWDLAGVESGPWSFAPLPEPAPADTAPAEGRIFVGRRQVVQDRKAIGPAGPAEEMPIETYVARVVQAEISGASPPGTEQALCAQAIAARSFLRAAMRRDPSLGTARKPIPNSTLFQVASSSVSARVIQATEATRGVTITYDGKPVLASFVAGAPWPKGGTRGVGKAPTEARVTYNQGRSGSAVAKAYPKTPTSDDRGALSQLGAVELARQGLQWPAILRYFYGEDVDFQRPGSPVDAAPERPAPRPPPRDEEGEAIVGPGLKSLETWGERGLYASGTLLAVTAALAAGLWLYAMPPAARGARA